MEEVSLLLAMPFLFFKALNAGKANACCAIFSLIMLLTAPILFGLLFSKKKLVNICFFCQAMLLSVILMIYDKWPIVILIAVSIVIYRRKFSGKLA